MSTVSKLGREKQTGIDADPGRAEAPRRSLLLTNHAGLHRKDPPWELVEHTVRELRNGEDNRFCCLEDQDGSYVQTLRGEAGYHLERRLTVGVGALYAHLRASYPGGSTLDAPLKAASYVNDGEARDILLCDDVVDAFREFYNGAYRDGWLDWRPIELPPESEGD
jgi:hypothetical protein